MAALTGDLKALRDYVTAPGQMQNQADGTVLLSVTHSNLKARFMEIRFDRHVRWHCPEGAAAARILELGALPDKGFQFGKSGALHPSLPPCPQALVSGVKSKLCFHTGTNPSAMRLSLRRVAGGAGQLLQDDHMLGYYSPCDGSVCGRARVCGGGGGGEGGGVAGEMGLPAAHATGLVDR